MRILVFGFAAVFVLLLHFEVHGREKGHAELVEHFCSALQAQIACDYLNMRRDTRGKIEAIVGSDFDVHGSKFWQVCFDAMVAFDVENLSRECRAAREKYGCKGRIEPGLLQDNPNSGGMTFCKYTPRQ